MEVILTEDVEKLGKRGEKIKVKDGFYRNFLFPRQMAVVCNKGNLRTYEEQQKYAVARSKREKEEASAVARKLEKVTLTLKAQVGEEDKLFGSITHQEIAKVLEGEGFSVDKRKIELEEPIKKTGSYTVKIKLHPDVETSVKVKIVKG